MFTPLFDNVNCNSVYLDSVKNVSFWSYCAATVIIPPDVKYIPEKILTHQKSKDLKLSIDKNTKNITFDKYYNNPDDPHDPYWKPSKDTIILR